LYKIYFYQDKNGKQPLLEYIKKLSSKNDKDSRIKINKTRSYIKMLSEYGTSIGEPYIKRIDGEIWELRPIRDRILFVSWVNNSFVLLHVFIKKTQKTPVKEIEKAKKELADLVERGIVYEK
jgi:phage-related protein